MGVEKVGGPLLGGSVMSILACVGEFGEPKSRETLMQEFDAEITPMKSFRWTPQIS